MKEYQEAFEKGFKAGYEKAKEEMQNSRYAELKKEFFPDFVDCYGEKDDD